MNIIIIGSGAREHVFSQKVSESPKCSHLYVIPGNAGTSSIATNIALGVNDFDAIAEFALKHDVAMIIVGPEEPLVKGIRNYFEGDEKLKHIKVIGPYLDGAELEGSKDFSKSFMNKYDVPTASSKTFHSHELSEALSYIKDLPTPIVLKADGLAAGKGVLICQSHEEANIGLTDMLANKKFGEASSKVVIEEFLDGIELSVFVLTDGEHYKILPEAKDYKRIGENDTGLNTGGMGAISPVFFADGDFMKKVEDKVVIPTIDGLKNEGISYAGFIFIGLMNIKGEPYVIEYNVRMGDPETQVVFPRINADFVDLFDAVSNQTLDEVPLTINPNTAATVVSVAGGYPEGYEKGDVITGIDEVKDALVFHAGTKLNDSNEIVTNGGRVISTTGMGNSIEDALSHAYDACHKISWKGKYNREDIGKDLIKKQQA